MQGVDTHDVIRIGVVPLVVGGGVVDRQRLNHLHATSHRPIDQPAQVAKVAHTVAVLTAQREHGDGDARHTPRLFAEPEGRSILHHHLSVGHIAVHHAVVAFLPGHDAVGLTVHHHIFIFHRHQPSQGIHRQHPFVLSGILQRQVVGGIPGAYRRMAATDGHLLALLQLRSRHAEDDGTAEQRQHHRLHLLAIPSVYGGQIGIAVEMVRQRTVAPNVGKTVVF